MRVADQPEIGSLHGEAGGRVGRADVLVDRVAGLPCQACTSRRRAAGLRDRIHTMSASGSRSRASSIDRTAADPGSPNRDGSAEPVAP